VARVVTVAGSIVAQDRFIKEAEGLPQILDEDFRLKI